MSSDTDFSAQPDSRPLRVLFLGKDASRGGMPRELSYILKYLDRNRFEPRVVLFGGGDLANLYQKSAPTEIYQQSSAQNSGAGRSLPARIGRKLRRETLRVLGGEVPASQQRLQIQRNGHDWLRNIVEEFQPELIVRHYHHYIWVFEPADDYARENNIPILQTVLLKGSQTSAIAEDIWRYHLESASRVLCPGRGTFEFLTRCLNVAPEKLSTVCTGLDLTVRDEQMSKPDRPTRADLGLADDDLIVMTSGGITYLKGVDLWVAAALKLRAKFPDRKLKFVWIGGAKNKLQSVYGAGVQRLAQAAGDDILFIGDQQEVYPYLALCDIYVQPSRDDAFPHATLEAMALGKPVVASAQGISLEEYSRDGIVRVDADSAQALAAGVAWLIEDDARCVCLGERGLKIIEEHLEIRATMREYEAVLELAAEEKLPEPAARRPAGKTLIPAQALTLPGTVPFV